LLLSALTGQFRSRVSLEAEILVLRDQLDVLSRKPRPCAGFQPGSTARLLRNLQQSEIRGA
jgi:hypothetical protein